MKRLATLRVILLIGSILTIPPGTLGAQEMSDSLVPKFSDYKANFLVTGFTAEAEVEFQISVKYRMFEVANLYFGYTQRSFWDLWMFEGSSPFRESNFSPEVLYRVVTPGAGALRSVQSGLLHQSNGRDGMTSRSWNRWYGEAQFSFLDGAVQLKPRAWIPFAVAIENPDLLSYLGYGDLAIEIQKPDRPDQFRCTILLHHGASRHWAYGGMSVGLVVKPITMLTGLGAVNTSFFLLYWNGYGESLETYNHFTRNIRIGSTFVL